MTLNKEQLSVYIAVTTYIAMVNKYQEFLVPILIH